MTVARETAGVIEARDRYLAENGFTVASYSEDSAVLSLFRLTIRIPNSEGRKRGLPFHDLHHVALGYGTDLLGEAEVSAWELRAGVRGYGLWVYYLIVNAVLMGLVLSPRRTIRAWRAARGQRSLYRHPLPHATLATMTVGQLRAHLGVPRDGVAGVTPRLHPRWNQAAAHLP